jgi:hypothetical protein
MSNIAVIRNLSAIAAFSLLSACAGPQPVAYSGLSSSGYLKPNVNGPAKIPYAYAANVNWRNYSKIIVEPVAVYQGPDNQFGNISSQDREALAAYMDNAFAKKLGRHYTLVDAPQPNTLRIKLTLTGAVNLYNGVQAVRGGPGAMTGSVFYSVEIYDAQSNQLLEAYVTKQYPNPENIMASFGSLGAAKTGIDKGANALVAQLADQG